MSKCFRFYGIVLQHCKFRCQWNFGLVDFSNRPKILSQCCWKMFEAWQICKSLCIKNNIGGAVVAHWGAVVAHRGAVVAHWGAVVAHGGAVVAHGEQWWLIGEQWWLMGSSGGSLVATPDCKTAVLGSNPAISPVYSGLLSWDGRPSGMALRCRLSSEGRQRKI